VISKIFPGVILPGPPFSRRRGRKGEGREGDRKVRREGTGKRTGKRGREERWEGVREGREGRERKGEKQKKGRGGETFGSP
jgi:hypothetical protein